MTNVVACMWNDPPQAQVFQHFVPSCWYRFFFFQSRGIFCTWGLAIRHRAVETSLEDYKLAAPLPHLASSFLMH